MLGYIAALLPLCVLVWIPLSNVIFGTPQKQKPSDHQNVLFNSSFIATDEPLSCPPHNYNTFILSQEPLIIYIENFLTAEESAHLISIRTRSEDKWAASTVTSGTETSIQKDIRFSEVALVDRDEVVRCIEHRSRAFQGWRPDLHIERLRTQRYGLGGHYKHHYDWSGGSREADRVSTFMVYVDADCEGGGTEFPRMKMPNVLKGRWCDFLECEKNGPDGDDDGGGGKGDDFGITFKPIKGNAVFWENLGADGRGYEQTFHAGLPVLRGQKVGLNIWSWGPARRT
ncbi:Prolyl 4-hydroxylase [Lachnellula hyalina]|uniref:Prolyl 4-hydroxylase n=1 Tax=Lachnellula hyalina TaxID=1316788 RepID=A0A8H8R4K7_9HELO|nr:Prolyl 4-hydroxylase [Lachnellula hyalina]TVY28487.1 Prolyl 4-hydroxylase [Lachnellula hyalina]